MYGFDDPMEELLALDAAASELQKRLREAVGTDLVDPPIVSVSRCDHTALIEVDGYVLWQSNRDGEVSPDVLVRRFREWCDRWASGLPF